MKENDCKIECGKWYTAECDLYSIAFGLCFMYNKSYYCEVDNVIRNEMGEPIEIDDWKKHFHLSTDEEMPPGYKESCKLCKLMNGWESCSLGYCYRYLMEKPTDMKYEDFQNQKYID